MLWIFFTALEFILAVVNGRKAQKAAEAGNMAGMIYFWFWEMVFVALVFANLYTHI